MSVKYATINITMSIEDSVRQTVKEQVQASTSDLETLTARLQEKIKFLEVSLDEQIKKNIDDSQTYASTNQQLQEKIKFLESIIGQSKLEEHVQKAAKGALSRINSENYSLQEKQKFLENKLQEVMLLLKDRNRDFTKGEISGDKISGGVIEEFASTGIKDTAKNVKLSIKDDRITVSNDLEVKGKIQCDTLFYYKAKTDNFDVKESIRIGGGEVLWQDRLGNSVTKSRLQELGVLKELNVADTLLVNKNKVGINVLEPVGVFGVSDKGIEISVDVKGDSGFVGTANSDPFAIGSGGEPTLYVSHDNKIGIKIKRPKADLDVAGYIRYQGQTQQYLNAVPTSGTWSQGDITWNARPDRGSVLGWVCVKAGSPGTWRPFVSID
jgi:hypothetical protein